MEEREERGARPPHKRLSIRLGAFLLALPLLAGILTHCGGPAVTVTTPTQIHRTTNQYVGHQVQVSGDLLSFHDAQNGTYYVLQDAEQGRIAVRDPAVDLSADVGANVTVRGVMDFDPSFGIYVQASIVRRTR